MSADRTLPRSPARVPNAGSQPQSGLPRSEEGLQQLYRLRDFAHFIQVYTLVCAHLRTSADFALITRELGASLAAQNVRYAEDSRVGESLKQPEPGSYCQRSFHTLTVRLCQISGSRVLEKVLEGGTRPGEHHINRTRH
jgi:Adenosine deaminase